jgi:hypothetical protein
MKKALFAILLISILFLAGCAVNTPPAVKYTCPDGKKVSDITECPQSAAPAQNSTNNTSPQPSPAPAPAPTPTVEPQSGPACGNGVCAPNENFANCAKDCAADYRYLYEFTDGLTYAYNRCDRIGDRVNCWEEKTYVEPSKVQKDPNTGQVYNVYNSYGLRIINGTDPAAATFNQWVNKSTSECLYAYDKAPSVSMFYNDSPVLDKIYTCPKIISVKYLGEEAIETPFAQFDKSQKFLVTYVRNPAKVPQATDTMTVWKVPGPLPAWKDYKFIVQGNVLVPVKAEWEWSYVDNQGYERHVVSNETLSYYIEPLDFGNGDSSIGQGVG